MSWWASGVCLVLEGREESHPAEKLLRSRCCLPRREPREFSVDVHPKLRRKVKLSWMGRRRHHLPKGDKAPQGTELPPQGNQTLCSWRWCSLSQSLCKSLELSNSVWAPWGPRKAEVFRQISTHPQETGSFNHFFGGKHSVMINIE